MPALSSIAAPGEQKPQRAARSVSIACCTGSGVCTPSAVNPCLPLVTTDNDCSGTCNEGTDMCTANDPATTGCNDNNQCTTGDACNASGVCASTNVANGTACTVPAVGTCQNGVCTP